jgi:uncharacterized protein YdaU (DUF1376 family)
MDYWKNGSPPDNDAVLAQITRMSADAWSNARSMLEGFFQVSDGHWLQARVESEMQKANHNKQTNSKRGKAGASARWSKNDAPSIVQAMPEQCSANGTSPSPSPASSSASSNDLGTNVPSPTKVEQKKLPGCAHQKVIDLYHQHLPTLRRVEVWNDARQAMLRSRWREVAAEMAEEKEVTEQEVLVWWEDFFQHIAHSKFLTGKVSGKDGRAFAADLEWIVRPTNFVKIVEGKYHGTN